MHWVTSEMLRDAGLVDVKVNVRTAAVTGTGDWYHTLLPTFIGLVRSQIVAGGLCEAGELDARSLSCAVTSPMRVRSRWCYRGKPGAGQIAGAGIT